MKKITFKPVRFRSSRTYRYPLFVISAFGHLIQDLRENAYLIGQMVQTYLKNQYRRSFLGAAWLIISPLLTVAVWWVLNYSGIVKPGTTGVPYLGFVLTGITLWNLFKGVYDLVSQSVAQFGPIILDAKVPVNCLFSVQLICGLLDFVIPFALNMIILMLLHFPMGLSSLLFLPALIPLILFAASLGMFIGICRVIAVDLANLWDKFMMFLMYLSPVVYARDVQNGLLAGLLKWNPLSYLIHVPRQLLFAANPGDLSAYWICSAIMLVLFCFVLYLFQRSERIIIERIFQ